MSVSPNTRDAIRSLLSESSASALRRERNLFDEQIGGTDGRIVIFGAGSLGRLCAKSLRAGGVNIITFCDNNRLTQGTTIDGLNVVSPKDAAESFGACSLFIVAIWMGAGNESMFERICSLKAIGCRFVVPFPSALWKFGREELPFHSFDLPSRLLARVQDIVRLLEMLRDEKSELTIYNELVRRLCGDFAPHLIERDQYFPPEIPCSDADTVFFDAGAYHGDTMQDFVIRSNGIFRRYEAFEPDVYNLQHLRKNVSALPREIMDRVGVRPVALSDRSGRIAFEGGHGVSAHVSRDGLDAVECVSLDALYDATDPTFLKVDVEGAEESVLKGAAATLRRSKPTVAVCVYHRPNDLWELPLLLQSYCGPRQSILRAHGYDGWETVFYSFDRHE